MQDVTSIGGAGRVQETVMGAKIRTLHPGDVVCGDRGDRLQTLLGSCVAIILTDPRRTTGAMCHIVHSSDQATQSASTAHAVNAMSAMFDQLRQRGIDPVRCEAYVYGGGNMFPDMDLLPVGEINADWALSTLAVQGIRVVDHDVGGARYRRLAWTVGSGSPQVEAVGIGGHA